jgi:hypothetical protein
MPSRTPKAFEPAQNWPTARKELKRLGVHVTRGEGTGREVMMFQVFNVSRQAVVASGFADWQAASDWVGSLREAEEAEGRIPALCVVCRELPVCGRCGEATAERDELCAACQAEASYWDSVDWEIDRLGGGS